MILFTLFTLGCKDKSRDPQVEEEIRSQVFQLFDSLDSAEEQEGFLLTFRPSAEASAKEAFTGKQLSGRLEFLAELEAELRNRIK